MKQGGSRLAARRWSFDSDSRNSAGLTISAAQQWCRRAAASRQRAGSASLRLRSDGFTIVEVLIVLAVTGFLFVAAVLLINGRQSKAQFTSAINTFQQELQQIIDETSNGYFPQNTSFSCARRTSMPPLLSPQANGDHQGTNPDCIFMGKVLQFAVHGTDPQAYRILPIVGNRLDTTGKTEAASLYGAAPALPTSGAYPEAAVAGTTPGTNSGIQGAESTGYLTQGLQVVDMWWGTNRAANKTGTAGFITSLPSPDGSGISSGTQHLSLYIVNSTAINQDTTYTADALYPGKITAQPLTAVNSVSICAASGTTNQSGLITIGPSDTSATSSLSVVLTLKSGTSC